MKKIKSGALILLILCILLSPAVSAADKSEDTVLLGGVPFGVSFQAGALRIGGFNEIETESGEVSPARDAGLLCDDIIKKVNGKEVYSAADVTRAVNAGDGQKIVLEICRKNESLTIPVTPVKSATTGRYLMGIWIKDTTAGLGTVTYIEKKTGVFGGLGHGIVEGETGELCRLVRGVVSGVTVTGVTPGKAGEPGELCGEFHSEKLGIVNKNTENGVFGVMTEYPAGYEPAEVELGKRSEVKNGGAVIVSTVNGDGPCEYSVEITCIEGQEEGNKNFLINVTDTSLIDITGGIVRGMSGSPVLQNGKLIGAVTHVLVSDPTRGYGIFIENMLEAENCHQQ